jgi:hypothetical protein
VLAVAGIGAFFTLMTLRRLAGVSEDFLPRYGWLGEGLWGVIGGLCSHPIDVVRKVMIEFGGQNTCYG